VQSCQAESRVFFLTGFHFVLKLSQFALDLEMSTGDSDQGKPFVVSSYPTKIEMRLLKMAGHTSHPVVELPMYVDFERSRMFCNQNAISQKRVTEEANRCSYQMIPKFEPNAEVWLQDEDGDYSPCEVIVVSINQVSHGVYNYVLRYKDTGNTVKDLKGNDQFSETLLKAKKPKF
jgi:hypothetical protein